MSTRADAVGERHGRLLVLSFAGLTKLKQSIWLCRCDCGRKVKVALSHMRHGKTRSCGCLYRESRKHCNYVHGASKTALFRRYWSMLNRCYNKNNHNFKHYGGRGITVCARWRGPKGYLNFIADMGVPPTRKHTIERKNNGRGYTPKNCVWATQFRQGANTRANVYIIVRGQRGCVKQLARQYGVPYARTLWRIHKGWTAERAIFEPAQHKWVGPDKKGSRLNRRSTSF